MAKRIGIDLGTTNSVVAWSANGTVANTVPNNDQERLTPSVVGRDVRNQKMLVGRAAVNFAANDPVNTVFSVKRLMARGFKDDEVKKTIQNVPYRIVPSSSGADQMAEVMIGETAYSPVDVSAMILSKLKEDAEIALSDTVTHAVITVPAYFDDNQRRATVEAGARAGLKVSRIVEEPTAAAYAFGIDQDAAHQQVVLVYDMGGGTFDISLIFLRNGIARVQSNEGDNWLGGDNFDSMIIDHIVRETVRKEGCTEASLRGDSLLMWNLKQQAEQAKKSLKRSATVDVALYGQLKGQLDIDVSLRQADFELWIRNDIDRSIKLVDTVLLESGLTPDDVDRVLLIGGSTGLTQVRTKLEAKFGPNKILSTVDPMEGVALGAAVLAARTSSRFCIHGHDNDVDAKGKCSEPDCNEVLDATPPMRRCVCGVLNVQGAPKCVACPAVLQTADIGGVVAKPYGLERSNGEWVMIIPKSTRYPMAKPMMREFTTASDRQDWIVFPILQQDPNTLITTKQLDIFLPHPDNGPIPEPKRVPKGTAIDIGFSLDLNGILTVHAQGRGALSWLSEDRIVEFGGTVPTPKPKCACGAELPHEGADCPQCGVGSIAARTEWERELINRLGYVKTLKDDLEWLLNKDDTDFLQGLIAEGDRALKDQNQATGEQAFEKLGDALHGRFGGLFDLVDAHLTYSIGWGKAEQHMKLGSLLDEFRRMALNRASSDELNTHRGKIRSLVTEIEGEQDVKDKIPCPYCGKPIPKPTPTDRKCPQCGEDVWGSTLR